MPPVTRRSLLTATALAGAGCVSLSNTDSRLCNIFIVNQYDETVTIELQLLEDDELLFEEAATLDPPPEGQRHGDSLFVQEEHLPTEAGHYRVKMRLADNQWETVDTTEYDDEHLLIFGTVTILEESGSPDVSIDPKQGDC